jgi:hypothetical protein
MDKRKCSSRCLAIPLKIAEACGLRTEKEVRF